SNPRATRAAREASCPGGARMAARSSGISTEICSPQIYHDRTTGRSPLRKHVGRAMFFREHVVSEEAAIVAKVDVEGLFGSGNEVAEERVTGASHRLHIFCHVISLGQALVAVCTPFSEGPGEPSLGKTFQPVCVTVSVPSVP